MLKTLEYGEYLDFSNSINNHISCDPIRLNVSELLISRILDALS